MRSPTITPPPAETPERLASRILSLAETLRAADTTLFVQTVEALTALLPTSGRPELMRSSFPSDHPLWKAFDTFITEDREQERLAVEEPEDERKGE